MQIFWLLFAALSILLVAKADDDDDYFKVGDWIDWI